MKKETVLIILAGGKSSRMDFPKGLLKHKNHFWILSQMESFIGEKITIGLGFDFQLYFDAIPWLAKAVEKPQNYQQKIVRVVINKTPEFGLFSTVQSVLKTLDTNQQVFVLPIDVPLLKSSEFKKIMDTENEIVIPTYNNKKGHPVKLAPMFWKSLLALNITDENSRLDTQIKKRNASEISMIAINDAAILKNLNTPKDWLEFIS